MLILSRIRYWRVFAHRSNSHHHHGPSPERDPGLLQLSRRQPESFPLPHPVHPGGGEASIPNRGQCSVEGPLPFTLDPSDPRLQERRYCCKVSFSRSEVTPRRHHFLLEGALLTSLWLCPCVSELSPTQRGSGWAWPSCTGRPITLSWR